jgi:hypothetical protein
VGGTPTTRFWSDVGVVGGTPTIPFWHIGTIVGFYNTWKQDWNIVGYFSDFWDILGILVISALRWVL